MKLINQTDIFTESGHVNRRYMYAMRYSLMPSTYYCSVDDKDNIIDLHSINSELITSLYPGSIMYLTSCRHVDDDVSCVTEERREYDPPVYGYGGVYALALYRNAEITVIIDYLKIILTFDDCSVEAIYDFDSSVNIEEFVDNFVEKLPKKPKDDEDEYPCVNLVSYSSDNGYSTVESEINSVDIDINKNYNDDFKSIYDDIVDFLSSEERKSGLVILNGEPGTGKTYFIRHIIKNIKNNYVLIPPSMAQNMSSPEFISFLMNNTNSVFILEDCETVIRNRGVNDFTSAVSSVLNMSDGLMSDIFNGKFICTFNADISSIDDAILRKGRCYAKYKFGKLDKEKAKVLLNERGIYLDAYDDMTLADIYNYDCKNVDNSANRRKIGF